MRYVPEILQHASFIRTKTEDQQTKIWDVLRKKWLVSQPEEFVRQCMIHYLTKHQNYPLKRIQIERSVKLNERLGRYDLMIVDKLLNPYMLIECKSFDVSLTENHFHQIVNYNMTKTAPYICITNGSVVGLFQSQKSMEGYIPLSDFPNYEG